MSSLTIIQQKDAVHLITDAAHYDMEGVVCSIASKVEELPNSGCVFALRGASYATIPLRFLLSRLRSLDAVTNALPGIISVIDGTFDDLTAGQAQPEQRHFEVTVAGWSDRMQSLVVGIATTYEPSDPNDPLGFSFQPGYETGVPFYAPPAVMIPPVDFPHAIGREIETQEDIDSLDPAVDGLAMFEAQRRYPALFAGDVQYLVGGFAELTTVRREGVTRRILKEWPDEVGRPLQPEGAAPVEELRRQLAEADVQPVRRWMTG